MESVLTISTIWCNMADSFQIGMFCSLCMATSCLFRCICNDLEREMANGDIAFRLKWFQDLYLTAMDFINVANELFGSYVGFLICAFIFQACCNTYNFFSHKFDIYLLFPTFFWLVESLFIIFSVCISAGEVATQVSLGF